MSDEQRSALFADGAVDVRGAERLAGISRAALYALMKGGRLPWSQVGKKRLIPRRALIDLLAANVKAAGIVA